MDLADRVRAAQLPPVDVRKSIRLAADVSLGEMGEELGVSPMTVMRWENGTSKPTRARAISYRALLDKLGAIVELESTES